MAAVSSVMKNSIFSLSRAFPRHPSLSLNRRASKVCFTTASKSSEQRNAAREESEGDDRTGSNRKETLGEAGNRASEMKEKAKQTTKQSVDRTKEGANEMEEKAKEEAEMAKEKASEAVGKTTEKAKEGTNRATEMAQSAKEKTKEGKGRVAETVHQVKDKTKEQVQGVTEKAKEEATTEDSIGEKAKQTVQGAWGVAKGAGKKIKETVVGKESEDNIDARKAGDGGKPMDDEDEESRGIEHEKKF